MIEFFSGLQWWHWWIAAAVLGIVEALIPGAVAIWFAAAAAVLIYEGRRDALRRTESGQ